MEICVFGASSMTIDKKYTDAVDEVLVKVIRAKKKKLKVVYI